MRSGNASEARTAAAHTKWRDAAEAEGRHISLHVEVVDRPVIQGSPGRLRELMTNLIFNAVDALPTGGTIRLTVGVSDAQGVVEVVDSGVGMTTDVQQRVFDPFFTTKGEGGTGLGLAMVFGIVEQHGGHIDVHSAPGVGTTVPGGATYREAHLVMEMLHDSGLVRSLDIVELNPFLDERGRTARVAVELIGSLFGQNIIDRPTPSNAVMP